MNAHTQNPMISALMAEISEYRKANGMSKTGFGVWAANDPNLLRDIEAGREPRWPTIQAIRSKMGVSPSSAGPQ